MLSRLINRRKEVGGLIVGHQLQNWWHSSFDLREQEAIKDRCKKPFSIFNNLAEGPPATFPQGTKSLLVNLAAWLTKDDVRSLGRKVMATAENLLEDTSDVAAIHMRLGLMINFYYKCRRDGPDFLLLCEQRCRDMINLAVPMAIELRTRFPKSALPCHAGYERLIKLLEDRNDPEAIFLSVQAGAQGWHLH